LDALQIFSTYSLALFNGNTLNLMMLWWLMKGCMGLRFCNAELVPVKQQQQQQRPFNGL